MMPPTPRSKVTKTPKRPRDPTSYGSTSGVVHVALRLMEERDRLLALRKDDIRRMIEAGVTSLRGGKGVDGDSFLPAMDGELTEMEARDRT
jgi:hypothetical protein